MKTRKFKKGDILINKWAGTPKGSYFIYQGITGPYVNGLGFNQKGELAKVQYQKSDVLTAKLPNGEFVFEKIGRTAAFEIMKENLQDFIQEDERTIVR